MIMFNSQHKIGDAIAKLRKEKGLTQNELAEKLQVSDKAISKWESNKGDPSIEFLPVMAELFGVTLDYLITGKVAEEKIVTISKLELCAKKDDPSILKDFSCSFACRKDEDGHYLMYYIKKYNSFNVLKALIDSCSHPTHYATIFSESRFDLPELLLLIKINREQVVMKNIAVQLSDMRVCLNNFSSPSLWRDSKGYQGVSYGYNEIFRYLVENYDKLDKSQQLYYFDLDDTTMICKQTCWSYAYPYFVDYAYKYNKKLLDKLMNKIIVSNKLYKEQMDEINRQGGDSYRWIESQVNVLNAKYLYVNLFSTTVLNAIDYEDYDMAYKFNEYVKEKIDEDVFEQARISKNTKLSAQEKALLHCIHNGIVSIDELIELNDFDLYEKTINEYPISFYEKDPEYSNHNKELNGKYLGKCIPRKSSYGIKNHALMKKKMYSSVTKEDLDKTRNYLFLGSVLNKDIRFIEKACKTATQQELDEALINIAPNNFKAINILLNYGAKLHKTWREDDGWGYIVDRDEIDNIGTEILKKKIKDVLGDE